MSSRCVPCGRQFNSDKSLQQHVRDAPAHFRCEACDRCFRNEAALEQHLRFSPAHAPSLDCEACDRNFSSREALEQHLRDSPAHTSSLVCDACDRSFGSDGALEQHLRDSPVHAASFDCETCDRSFGSDGALQQHLRDSPAHALPFACETCDRSFGSQEALNQHLRDSPVHQQDIGTPLDVFFRSFATFNYDPSLPPAESYDNLRRHHGWHGDSIESSNAWESYQDALNSEVEMWYDAEDDLRAWHSLCRAIGIEPLPKTCEQCERATRRTHVNIIDLIQWRRSGDRGNVPSFPDVEKLALYTRETKKIFSKTIVQENGNAILRHLLRKIFYTSKQM